MTDAKTPPGWVPPSGGEKAECTCEPYGDAYGSDGTCVLHAPKADAEETKPPNWPEPDRECPCGAGSLLVDGKPCSTCGRRLVAYAIDLPKVAAEPAPAVVRDEAWWLASAQSLVHACWLDLGTEKRKKIAWWLRATFGQDPAPAPDRGGEENGL